MKTNLENIAFHFTILLLILIGFCFLTSCKSNNLRVLDKEQKEYEVRKLTYSRYYDSIIQKSLQDYPEVIPDTSQFKRTH